MRISIGLSTIDSLKAEMLQALPHIKSSHRVEAMARGLGWSTNAAMRADLAHGTALRTVRSDAFATYLAERHLTAWPRCFVDTVLKALIRAVMDAHPELTHHGFGVYEEQRISSQERQTRYETSRAEMLSARALGEFERGWDFLESLERTKAPTRVFTSYNLKHTAERWHRHRGIEGRWERAYVSNGMLLAAAVALGLQVKRANRVSFVGFLNVSTASARDRDPERQIPPLPQPEDGQPFRVLGRSNGRCSYLPAGQTKPITLNADAHTPRNLLRLAPIDYWVTRYPPPDRRSPFNTFDAYCELFLLASKAGILEPRR
jgi:hypothetical protein